MFEPVASREAGIGFTIGDVGAELAIFCNDWSCRDGVVAKFAQWWFGWPAAAEFSWLSKQSKCLIEGERENFIVRCQSAAVFFLGDIGPVTTALGGDVHPVGGVGADEAR